MLPVRNKVRRLVRQPASAVQRMRVCIPVSGFGLLHDESTDDPLCAPLRSCSTHIYTRCTCTAAGHRSRSWTLWSGPFAPGGRQGSGRRRRSSTQRSQRRAQAQGWGPAARRESQRARRTPWVAAATALGRRRTNRAQRWESAAAASRQHAASGRGLMRKTVACCQSGSKQPQLSWGCKRLAVVMSRRLRERDGVKQLARQQPVRLQVTANASACRSQGRGSTHNTRRAAGWGQRRSKSGSVNAVG